MDEFICLLYSLKERERERERKRERENDKSIVKRSERSIKRLEISMCESILSPSPENYKFQRTGFDEYQLW
jgi:hypothetical protein